MIARRNIRLRILGWTLATTMVGLLAATNFSARPLPPQGSSALPKDVDPDSRNRLPIPKPDEMDGAAKKTYDAAAAKNKPLDPDAEIKLYGGTYGDIRYESPLGRRLIELAIITAARETEQLYEWTLHSEEALRVGVQRPIVEIVRYRKPLKKLDEKDAVIIELGREMFGKHKVAPETFANALRIFGKRNLVDIISLEAQYAGTAARLNMFDQRMPIGWKTVVPLPLSYKMIPSPPDIYPDSRNRLTQVKRDQPAVKDPRILAPPGTGPGQILAHGSGGKFLEADIGRQLIEITILVTARESDQQYEWTMHEVAARQQGLDPTIIDIIRDRKPVTGLGEKEATIIEVGRNVLTKHFVSSELCAQTVKLFGDRDAVDIVGVMAQHTASGSLLTAFDQQLPAGQEPLLPTH